VHVEAVKVVDKISNNQIVTPSPPPLRRLIGH